MSTRSWTTGTLHLPSDAAADAVAERLDAAYSDHLIAVRGEVARIMGVLEPVPSDVRGEWLGDRYPVQGDPVWRMYRTADHLATATFMVPFRVTDDALRVLASADYDAPTDADYAACGLGPRRAAVTGVTGVDGARIWRDTGLHIEMEGRVLTIDGRSENSGAGGDELDTPTGREMIAALNRVTWMPGTGGVIVHADEYDTEGSAVYRFGDRR